MKIRFENLIASVRTLTGAFACFITIAVGAALNVDPVKLLEIAIAAYVFFYIFGSTVAKMLERVNYEVSDIDRDKAADKKPGEKRLGGLLDIKQGSESPFA